MAQLWATSDLHIGFPDNRDHVLALRPADPEDWLIVAGDVGEHVEDVVWALEVLRGRFARVVWTPGNHELWTPRNDPVQLAGVARYEHLVERCRSMDVLTPEDPYPVWHGAGGPATVAPVFTLYDYSFCPDGFDSGAEARRTGMDRGVICTDEVLLHPDPYPGVEAWCRDRVDATRARLEEAADPAAPFVLVGHFPLVREPTRVLTHPEFAVWCGTELTHDWHRRFPVVAAVYGHLHIPRTTWYDGVRFEEVSVGYPREWSSRSSVPPALREILPGPASARDHADHGFLTWVLP